MDGIKQKEEKKRLYHFQSDDLQKIRSNCQMSYEIRHKTAFAPRISVITRKPNPNESWIILINVYI